MLQTVASFLRLRRHAAAAVKRAPLTVLDNIAQWLGKQGVAAAFLRLLLTLVTLDSVLVLVTDSEQAGEGEGWLQWGWRGVALCCKHLALAFGALIVPALVLVVLAVAQGLLWLADAAVAAVLGEELQTECQRQDERYDRLISRLSLAVYAVMAVGAFLWLYQTAR